jgi:S1-C subfamily serine protease
MRQTAVAIASLLMMTAALRAQSTRPALDALDREVQQLYRQAQERTVRVIVPIHISNNVIQQEHPLSKWNLSPEVREKLASVTRTQGGAVYIEQRPATTQGSAAPEMQRVPLPSTSTVMNAEFIGLILNDRGDVLVPLHIDAAYLDGPLHVTVDDRRVTTATVVAADRQTSLTVIRLAQPAGQAAKFAQAKPPIGSLLLLMSPMRRAARLGVWSGGAEDNAVLVNAAGEFAGIVRNGHALFPSTFGPVVDQLLRGQQVKRAQLGVLIREVLADDPARAQVSALGSRPAARVIQVFENSAAAAAGLLKDDLILSMGDEPVEDVPTFAAAIANQRGRTPFRIIRSGAEQTVTIDLRAD